MPAPMTRQPARPGRPAALRTAVAVLTVTVALAGCSRAPDAAPGTPGPVSASSVPDTGTATASSPAGGSSQPVSSSAPASTAQSATTAAGSSTAASSTAVASPVVTQPDGPGGCATAVLRVRALRASGAAGHQYAFLSFTNTSASPCSLTGFPGVRLLRAGAPLGPEAQRTAKPVSRVQIAPGDSVTAQLTDDSTCNAQNSDAVQVIPPNRTEKFVLPLTLRGCSLHIDPVGAG